jgi:hypothetical protein
VVEVEYREWNIEPLVQSFATAIAKNRELRWQAGFNSKRSCDKSSR